MQKWGPFVMASHNSIPKKRQDLLKWNGWGYSDTTLDITSTGILTLRGDRYLQSGAHISEPVRQYFIDTLNWDLYAGLGPRKPQPKPEKYPEPLINKEFVADIVKRKISHTFDGDDRLFRGHGHTVYDIVTLREGSFPRIPDIVVWPGCHEDVVQIVQLANKHNVVVIPFGGGTNVTRALECDTGEMRMIVSLDTSQMSSILWVDKANLLACCESGIIGQDLERELSKQGFTTGHEPDSYEFSSLGGWVATRASGMKKNEYGNIEDLVVHVRFVTSAGVLEKQNQAPRVSCGPDLTHLVLGSEGTLGVVTEVIIKIRPIPEVREYSSFVFPSFQCGVDFMREVARKRCQPASLRLVDNEQFKMGQAFKEPLGYFGSIIDAIKMLYVTKYKGIDLDSMCVAIALFEGDREDVQIAQRKIARLASQFQGFSAGTANGERGYLLTFTIAYIRDICLSQNVIAESFETSVTWDRCANLCRNVKHTIARECKARGIVHFLASCRVTQVYDSGAAVYFYFGFNATGFADGLHVYEEIEAAARDEIIACGGSISHHHGVGKIRQRWFPKQVSPVGVELYKAVKQKLDPKNIFASGNLISQKSSL